MIISDFFFLPLKHKICRHLLDTHVQLNLLNFVEICQVAITPMKKRENLISSEGSLTQHTVDSIFFLI